PDPLPAERQALPCRVAHQEDAVLRHPGREVGGQAAAVKRLRFDGVSQEVLQPPPEAAAGAVSEDADPAVIAGGEVPGIAVGHGRVVEPEVEALALAGERELDANAAPGVALGRGGPTAGG